jgi:hypothetical protein
MRHERKLAWLRKLTVLTHHIASCTKGEFRDLHSRRFATKADLTHRRGPSGASRD